MGSNYVPLYVFLFCFLGIGVILPMFIYPFVDANIVNTESIISPFISFITDGFQFSILGLGSINFNFFFWLPEPAHQYMINYFNTFTYVPNVIAVPLAIVMFASLGYTVIKLFWGN